MERKKQVFGKLGQAVAAVWYEDTLTGQQKERSVFVGKIKEILDAELQAVLETLNIANSTGISKNTLVIIFCNSQKVPNTIASTSTGQKHPFQRSCIYHRTKKLQSNRHHIKFHRVPGHSEISGDEKANLSAKIELKKLES